MKNSLIFKHGIINKYNNVVTTIKCFDKYYLKLSIVHIKNIQWTTNDDHRKNTRTIKTRSQPKH